MPDWFIFLDKMVKIYFTLHSCSLDYYSYFILQIGDNPNAAKSRVHMPSFGLNKFCIQYALGHKKKKRR
jgi:hypothetical protein